MEYILACSSTALFPSSMAWFKNSSMQQARACLFVLSRIHRASNKVNTTSQRMWEECLQDSSSEQCLPSIVLISCLKQSETWFFVSSTTSWSSLISLSLRGKSTDQLWTSSYRNSMLQICPGFFMYASKWFECLWNDMQFLHSERASHNVISCVFEQLSVKHIVRLISVALYFHNAEEYFYVKVASFTQCNILFKSFRSSTSEHLVTSFQTTLLHIIYACRKYLSCLDTGSAVISACE